MCTGASKAKQKPAKKQRGGQAAADAIKSAAKQRRKDKKSAAASVAPEDENAWGPYDKKGREIGETDDEDSEEDEAPYVPQVSALGWMLCLPVQEKWALSEGMTVLIYVHIITRW